MKTKTDVRSPKVMVSLTILLALLISAAGSVALSPTTRASEATNQSHAATAPFDLSKWYYLVPAAQPTRGVTYEMSSRWDWAILSGKGGSAQKPSGTPVKFSLESNGRYSIQMQSSHYHDYRHFCQGLTGIYLEQEDGRSTWNIEKTEGGFLFWYEDNEPFIGWFQYYMMYETSGKPWLNSRKNQKTVWSVIPAN